MAVEDNVEKNKKASKLDKDISSKRDRREHGRASKHTSKTTRDGSNDSKKKSSRNLDENRGSQSKSRKDHRSMGREESNRRSRKDLTQPSAIDNDPRMQRRMERRQSRQQMSAASGLGERRKSTSASGKFNEKRNKNNNGMQEQKAREGEMVYGGGVEHPGIGERRASWRPHTAAGYGEVLLLMLLTTFPIVVFILTFSDFGGVGHGARVHEMLASYSWARNYFGGGSVMLALTLYILDASYWQGKMLVVKRAMLLFIVFGICLGCLFAASDYPSAPMCVFVVGSVVYFVLLRNIFFYKQHPATFFGYLAIAMTTVGTVVCASFMFWMMSDEDNFWPGEDSALKLDHNIAMGCDCKLNVTIASGEVVPCIVSGLEDYETCCVNYVCLAGYLLWFAPFVSGFISFIFGLLAYYMSKTITATSTVHPGLKLFGTMVMVVAIGMWVAASVSSTDGQMAQAALMFSFVSLGLMGAFIVSVVGYQALIDMFMSIPIVKTIRDSLFSDWIRALFMVTASPMFAMYLMLSTINQILRKQLSCTKDVDGAERGFRLTLVAHRQWVTMSKWAWSSVHVKIMYLCIFFLTISVGISKLTTLFLSWLNETLTTNFLLTGTAESPEVDPNGFVKVCAIFFIVGLTMFLLPPVPGVPVYITGGVVLVNAYRESYGSDDGTFWLAILFTSVFCFFIKLTAVFSQQVGIGMRMSGSVKIRHMVGVNSVSIQAIRFILEKPGFSKAKVSILCGGPDWPTSVLTGILRLSPIKMLLGSLPVYFLIAPCVAAGAFLLRVNDDGPWASLAPVMASLAALVQTIVMFAAAYYIEQAATENRELLLSRCNDKEVEAIDEKIRAKNLAYRTATDWHKSDFPKWVKLNLVAGSMFTGFACWIIQVYGASCFEEFDLTSKIEDLPDGKAMNLVKPFGWYTIGIFAVGLVNLKIFFGWASKQVKAADARDENHGST